MFLRGFLVLVLMSLAMLAHAGIDVPTVTLDGNLPHQALGRFLLVQEDADQLLTIESLDREEFAARFVRSQVDSPSFGISHRAYWARTRLHNASTRTHWVLEHGDSNTLNIDFWIRRGDGRLEHHVLGEMHPGGEHRVDAITQAISFDIAPGETVELTSRIQSDFGNFISLSLWTPEAFARHNTLISIFHGLYTGIVLAMVAYNAFVYQAMRERSHLLYILTVSAVCISNNLINGMIGHYLFDDQWQLTHIALIISSTAMMPLLVSFSREFLGDESLPVRIVSWLVPLISAISLVSLWAGIDVWTQISGFNGFLVCAVFPWISLRNSLKGDRAAMFYLLGFGWFFVGAIIFQLGLVGVITFMSPTLEIGSCFEAIFLSLALAQRLRQTRLEKEAAQNDALQQKLLAIEHKQLALDTVTQYSKKLEHDVQARTRELIDTQQKLIASEKMAALGVFTAGMAHEINNPANFVAAGAQNAQAQVAEFRQFVHDILDEDADPEISGAFGGRFEKLDASLGVIRSGIQRIEGVVKHLRATHPEGEAGFQPADVIGTLESAWNVIQPTLKTDVTLVTEFTARPSVNCMIAELNQVFLALLSNAVHAIEDAKAARDPALAGVITLRSRRDQTQLIIEVEDNGIGIPDALATKIFDPFFTTKTVGRGAGLGLSMSRDVVQQHQGTLEARTTASGTTVFALTLPLDKAVTVAPQPQ